MYKKMKMKTISKLLLAFAIAMAAATTSTAQSSYRVYSMQFGKYSEYAKKWSWDDPVDVSLRATLDGNLVRINDEAGTKIWTYEDLGQKSGVDADGDSYRRHNWRGYDEKNRKCLFTITWYVQPRLTYYTIIYSDFAFRYYINRETEL